MKLYLIGFTALINLGGLWAGVATQAYLASNMIVVMSLVNETDWVPTPGEQYAIYLGIIVFGLGSSLLSGVKFTRRLDSSMTWVSILGLGAFAITILAMAKPKASAVSDRMWASTWCGVLISGFVDLCLYGCLQLFRLELDDHRLVDRSAQLFLRFRGVRPVRYRPRPLRVYASS
jgi:hypothetical protein